MSHEGGTAEAQSHGEWVIPFDDGVDAIRITSSSVLTFSTGFLASFDKTSGDLQWEYEFHHDFNGDECLRLGDGIVEVWDFEGTEFVGTVSLDAGDLLAGADPASLEAGCPGMTVAGGQGVVEPEGPLVVAGVAIVESVHWTSHVAQMNGHTVLNDAELGLVIVGADGERRREFPVEGDLMYDPSPIALGEGEVAALVGDGQLVFLAIDSLDDQPPA